MQHNPSDAVQPDFTSDIYAAVRAALVTAERDDAAAAAFLGTTWISQNDADRDIWQASEDLAAADAAEQRRIALEADVAAEQEKVETLRTRLSKGRV